MNRPQILKLPANQREIHQGPGKYSIRLNLDLFSEQDRAFVLGLAMGEPHFTPIDSEGNAFAVPRPHPTTAEEWMDFLRLVQGVQVQLVDSLQPRLQEAREKLESLRQIQGDRAFFLAYDPFADLESHKDLLKKHHPDFMKLKQEVDQRRWSVFMNFIRQLDQENRDWVAQHGSEDLKSRVQHVSAARYFFSTIEEQIFLGQEYQKSFYDAQFGFPHHEEPFQQYVLERVEKDYPYGVYTDGRYELAEQTDNFLPDLSGFPDGQWVRLTGYPHDLPIPGKRVFLDLMISSFVAEQFYCVRIKTPVGEVLYPLKPLPTLVDSVWHFFINPECEQLKASAEFGVNEFLIYSFLDPVTFDQLKGDREISIEMPVFTKVNASFSVKLFLETRVETTGKVVHFKLLLSGSGGLREVRSEGQFPFSEMYVHRYIVFHFDEALNGI